MSRRSNNASSTANGKSRTNYASTQISNTSSHPMEHKPEHLAFLQRSLDRNDVEMAAVIELNHTLHVLREQIIIHCSELTLLDIGEGILRLAPDDGSDDYQERIVRVRVIKKHRQSGQVDVSTTDNDDYSKRDDVKRKRLLSSPKSPGKVLRMKSLEEDDTGHIAVSRNVADDGKDGDEDMTEDHQVEDNIKNKTKGELFYEPYVFESQYQHELCIDFILRMKLRKRLLSRIIRRLLRLATAMDGNDVSPPPVPSSRQELSLTFENSHVSQVIDRIQRQQQALSKVQQRNEDEYYNNSKLVRAISNVVNDHVENIRADADNPDAFPSSLAEEVKSTDVDEGKNEPKEFVLNEEDVGKNEPLTKTKAKKDGGTDGNNEENGAANDNSLPDSITSHTEEEMNGKHVLTADDITRFYKRRRQIQRDDDYVSWRDYKETYEKQLDPSTGEMITYTMLSAQKKHTDDDNYKNGIKTTSVLINTSSSNSKEFDLEWKRYKDALLSRIPIQPTYEDLDMEYQLFSGEERRRRAIEKKEKEEKTVTSVTSEREEQNQTQPQASKRDQNSKSESGLEKDIDAPRKRASKQKKSESKMEAESSNSDGESELDANVLPSSRTGKQTNAKARKKDEEDDDQNVCLEDDDNDETEEEYPEQSCNESVELKSDIESKMDVCSSPAHQQNHSNREAEKRVDEQQASSDDDQILGEKMTDDDETENDNYDAGSKNRDDEVLEREGELEMASADPKEQGTKCKDITATTEGENKKRISLSTEPVQETITEDTSVHGNEVDMELERDNEEDRISLSPEPVQEDMSLRGNEVDMELERDNEEDRTGVHVMDSNTPEGENRGCTSQDTEKADGESLKLHSEADDQSQSTESDDSQKTEHLTQTKDAVQVQAASHPTSRNMSDEAHTMNTDINEESSDDDTVDTTVSKGKTTGIVSKVDIKHPDGKKCSEPNETEKSESKSPNRKPLNESSTVSEAKPSQNTPPKKIRPISLVAIPSFYEQDRKRIKLIHSNLLNSSMQSYVRKKLEECVTHYNNALKISSEIHERRQRAQSKQVVIASEIRHLQSLNRDYLLKVNIAKEQWRKRRFQFEQNRNNLLLPSRHGIYSQGTTYLQRASARHDHTGLTQQVCQCLGDVVDVVSNVASGRLRLDRFNETFGAPPDPFVSDPKTGESILMMKQRIEKELLNEIEQLTPKLKASEDNRIHAWRKMLKVKAEHGITHDISSSGVPRFVKVDSNNITAIPVPVLRMTSTQQFIQTSHNTPKIPPVSTVVGATQSRIPPLTPTNDTMSQVSESKYSAARVKERIASDGTVKPVEPPKKGKDGLYLRPAGRTRKGMEWDAVRGVWIKNDP